MPAARPSEAVIRNAIEAWKAAGLPVGRMTIRDGAIIIEALPDQTEPAQPARQPKAWQE